MGKPPEKFNTNSLKMDYQDLELQQYLKNWADQQPLPLGGRAQLISAIDAFREKGRKKAPPPSPPRPDELVSWPLVYCAVRTNLIAIIIT
jgi:hypothetical protein